MYDYIALNNLHFRKDNEGFSDEYCQIYEKLGDYAQIILSKLEVDPTSIDIKSGEMGVVLIVNDLNEKFVVKIYAPGTDMNGVNYFYSQINKLNIKSPKLLSFDISKSLIPYEFQVMSYIEGSELSSLPNNYHYEGGLLLAENIREMHTIRTDGFGSPDVNNKWSYDSWMEALADMYGFELKEGRDKVFSNSEVSNIESLIWEDDKLDIQSPYLIHCDVSGNNGLFTVNNGQLSLQGIIDPGVIQGGDPMWDLAYGTHNDSEFAKGFYDGYIKLGQLSEDEKYRYMRLKLFCSYWTACWQSITHRDFTMKKEETLKQLAVLI